MESSVAARPVVWYESPNWSIHIIQRDVRWSTDHERGDIDGDRDWDILRIGWDDGPTPDLRHNNALH